MTPNTVAFKGPLFFCSPKTVPVRYSTLSHSLHQSFDSLGLTSPSGPQHHHTVTHTLCLKQLKKKKLQQQEYMGEVLSGAQFSDLLTDDERPQGNSVRAKRLNSNEPHSPLSTGLQCSVD